MVALVIRHALIAWHAVVVAVASAVTVDPMLERPPTWSIPSEGEVRARVEGCLPDPSAPMPPAVAEAWGALADARGDRLKAVITGVAVVDPRVADVIDAARHGRTPDLAWLDAADTPEVLRDSVELWWARELVRCDRYDEALPLLRRLDLARSIDPATLLFCRGACEHWLLETDASTATLDQLLERERDIPVRYARVARLLRDDIAALSDDSLDHIARRMRDVTRRLGLGRTGTGTREVQEGVVASLDELIDKLEQQSQQEEQGGGASGGGAGSGQGGAGQPMDDSRVAGGRGAGDMVPRDLDPGEDWGDLPPHERDRALQQIGREFPPHYREAIEEYFKRLAAGAEDR